MKTMKMAIASLLAICGCLLYICRTKPQSHETNIAPVQTKAAPVAAVSNPGTERVHVTYSLHSRLVPATSTSNQPNK